MYITYNNPPHPRACSAHCVAHGGRSYITWAVACNVYASRRPRTFRPNMLVARCGGCGTRSEKERDGLAAPKEQSNQICAGKNPHSASSGPITGARHAATVPWSIFTNKRPISAFTMDNVPFLLTIEPSPLLWEEYERF